MTLVNGSRLGSYEILTPLGEGGMGEVYRARDTKLNRDVAIKVLPELFATDPERLARFKREAQMLAALNHPNIAHLYGLEGQERREGQEAQAGDTGPFLVMELVEGPTLADLLAQRVNQPKPSALSHEPSGALAVSEALDIARQIAEALQAAHEQGIIHRDLKPANVKVREDGTVKVLDFGLAKMLEAGDAGTAGQARGAGALAGLTQSPTLTTPAMPFGFRSGHPEQSRGVMTGVGMILGTAAYMAPEQAKGRAADKRSDAWAFGAVLYEMLTGRRAFEGEDLSDTLANVLKTEPDWSALAADVPAHVRTLVQRCLAKDRRQRIADMSVALFVMAEAANLAPAAVVTSGTTAMLVRPPLWRRLVMPTAAAIVIGAAVGTVVWIAMRPSAPPITRFGLSPTGAAALAVDPISRDLAITPDGTHIVYKGRSEAPQLFVRALDQLEPTPLTGLPSPRAPFSSPDGQWIGFVDSGAQTLKKVAITGGPALVLCGIDGNSRGGTWGDDGTIIFATNSTATGLQRVSSGGGELTVLTKPDRERGEADHLWPQFLPGSQAVLFTIAATTGGIDAAQVAVLDLRTGARKVLVRGGSQAQYLPSGHLVYAANGTLRAIAFDLKRLEAIGTSVPVVPQLMTLPTGTAEFDVSRNGTLIYVAGGGTATPPRTLVWVDRQGHEEGIKAAPARSYVAPRLSPQGSRLALEISDQDNDIWVWNFASENLTRVTSDPGLDRAPVWLSDSRVAFSSQANGSVGAIFAQSADGTGAPEPLTQSTLVQLPSAVSPDGMHILFSMTSTRTTSTDVMMLTLDKERRVQALVSTQAPERNGEISPDGRWLAYQSSDSGSYEIYVRPFPDVNKGRWQVSTGGGTQPVWARSGEELFYLALDGALMSVRVKSGPTWTASTPTKVIAGPYYYGSGAATVGRTYDVSLDGKRFLMIKEPGGGSDKPPAPPSIVVVENWLEELKRLVPTAR